jgi:hypothetical protein
MALVHLSLRGGVAFEDVRFLMMSCDVSVVRIKHVVPLNGFVCADRVVYEKYTYQGPGRISGPSRLAISAI